MAEKYIIVKEVEADSAEEALRKRKQKLVAVFKHTIKPNEHVTDAIGFAYEPPDDDE